MAAAVAVGGRVLLCVVATLLLIDTSAAISCFYCNSANNSACLDVRENEKYNIIPVVDCAEAIPSNVAVSFFCRKIVQTIFRPGHDSELRVTRGCGWKHHVRDCYKADNTDHLETVCQCFEDRCNSAPPRSAATAAPALAVAVALAAFAHRRQLFHSGL